MKIESFYCEHTRSLFGKSPRTSALEYATNLITENYKDGYTYKCNVDAIVEVAPGCWRKIIRFILRKRKEDVIIYNISFTLQERKEEERRRVEEHKRKVEEEKRRQAEQRKREEESLRRQEEERM